MHALRNIHRALVPDGLLVDTQPISGNPRVSAGGVELGRVDMHEWVETIHAVDQRVDETVVGGLYELEDEREIVVTDGFDNGPECVDIVGSWQDTHIPAALMNRLATIHDPVAVEQRVRLRVFRAVA